MKNGNRRKVPREKSPRGRQRPQEKKVPLRARPLLEGRRLWLFRFILAAVVPALMLVGLEVGLRTLGYGVPTGFTFKQKVDDETIVLSNPYFPWRFLPPEWARDLIHFSRPLKKEKETYRIFVLGGSAAQGVPEPAYGITRMLDTMLRDQYPGVAFDVINAGITAINSHVVLPIARDCGRLGSDLFVIYLGNNEVVGPYGAGTRFSPLVSNLTLIRWGIALKATRLGQLVSNTAVKIRNVQGQPRRWRGMAMFLNNRVRAADPGMAIVYRHFEKNLLDICRVAEELGIPAIVSTVGANLKDSPPFASLHHPGLAHREAEEWERIVREAGALQGQGQFEQAVERFLQAEKMDADYAELHFRMARCYWEMGYFEEARERYMRARDLDVLRFRADTRINEVIRRVAGVRPKEGIHLVDSVRVLEANSPNNTPGSELFYEHVHLNLRGTYLVARAIFERVQALLPEWVSRHASGHAVLSEQACARRLAYTTWDRLAIAEMLLGQMQGPPFVNQLYADERLAKLSEELRELRDRYAGSEGPQKALAAYESVLGDDSHWSLHKAYAEFLYGGLDNKREAEKHMRAALEQCPQSAVGLSFLGEILSSQGEYAEAEKYHRRALVYDPRSTSLLTKLGMVLMRQGRYDEATRYLKEAVEIDPGDPVTHGNLATLLNRTGDQSRDAKETRQTDLGDDVLRADPQDAMGTDRENAKAHVNRGVAHASRGLLDRAIADYSRAMAIDPGNLPALVNRGAAYAGKGLVGQAAADYAKAIEIAPDSATAYNNLAWMLATFPAAEHRDGDKAVRYAEKAVEIEPSANRIDTLAAAYAEAGRFEDAVKAQEKRIGLLEGTGNRGELDEAIERLARYRERQPHRQSP